MILIAVNAGNLAKRGEQAAKDEEYINPQQQSSEAKTDSEVKTTSVIAFVAQIGVVINRLIGIDFGDLNDVGNVVVRDQPVTGLSERGPVRPIHAGPTGLTKTAPEWRAKNTRLPGPLIQRMTAPVH